ncbi:unnamed protein product [Lymnaea stagnalis]|uniref:Uncharacterized protein n=1 Tax=Lymnaea stagnalis TaxID=6523 RepID=A0AAV2IGY5_LYMST
MDMLDVTVLLLALLTAVGVSNGQQSGCSTAQNDCQRSAAAAFGNSSATDEDKCGKTKEALSCIKNLTCTSDVTFRALFLVTLDRLTALNLSSCGDGTYFIISI